MVQTLGELLQLPGGHQFAQMPVHRSGQTCEIFPPIDAAGLQFVRKVRGGASRRLSRIRNGGRHG
jgi:hypothetical protein